MFEVVEDEMNLWRVAKWGVPAFIEDSGSLGASPNQDKVNYIMARDPIGQ